MPSVRRSTSGWRCCRCVLCTTCCVLGCCVLGCWAAARCWVAAYWGAVYWGAGLLRTASCAVVLVCCWCAAVALLLDWIMGGAHSFFLFFSLSPSLTSSGCLPQKIPEPIFLIKILFVTAFYVHVLVLHCAAADAARLGAHRAGRHRPRWYCRLRLTFDRPPPSPSFPLKARSWRCVGRKGAPGCIR